MRMQLNIREREKCNFKKKRFSKLPNMKHGHVTIVDNDAEPGSNLDPLPIMQVRMEYAAAVLALLNDNPHDTLNLKPAKRQRKKADSKPIDWTGCH